MVLLDMLLGMMVYPMLLIPTIEPLMQHNKQRMLLVLLAKLTLHILLLGLLLSKLPLPLPLHMLLVLDKKLNLDH